MSAYSEMKADLAALRAEVKSLKKRLEWLPNGPDGIECRNETIKLQDQAIEKLHVRIKELNAEIEDLWSK